MVSKNTLNILANVSQRLAEVESECIKDWHGLCNCPTPGKKLECLDCPYFKELMQDIQSILASKLDCPATKVFPVFVSPEISPPYSVKVQHQCLEMYKAGYSINQIQFLTGVSNRRTLRHWFREAGILKTKTSDYSEEIKEQCVQLYQQGMQPREVEDFIGVSADLVREWAYKLGIARPRKKFSRSQKEQCLKLYKQGKLVQDIEQETEVPSDVIKTWVKRAKIHRAKVYQPVGLPIHSPEVRERCRQLFEQGKTPEQIEELFDINADTIRQWRKEWQRKPE